MHEQLSVGGWIFIATSWGGIIALNVWCFINIFKERTEEIVEPLAADEDQSTTTGKARGLEFRP